MTKDSVVSVIVPYYAAQQYIRETVLSAVDQQGAHMEVIVIDDGSPEPVGPHLQGINNVQIIRVPNQGCAASRNFGFQQSTGDYILFLDHDDVLQPGAVAAHLEALAKEPDAALSFGSFRVVDAEGRELEPPYVTKRKRNFHQMMFQMNPMPSPGTALFRRSALEQVGGFSSSFSTQVDDYDLYLRLIRKWPFTRHSTCVLNYRQHGSNVSNDRQKMQKGTLEVLDRIAASGQLTPSEMRRVRYGRNRWIHHYNPSTSVRYRLRALYYKFRTMLTLPPSVWFE